MKYRKLGNTDMDVSVLSYGASPLGSVFREVRIEDCIETVRTVLDGGINLLDVSPAYGETLAEKNLGISLKGIARDRYYLATKVGSYRPSADDYDYSAARTRQSVHDSLERLGTDYLDIVHCHDIEYADHNVIVEETLPALQALKEEGKLRYIGITGLPLKIFPSILDRVDKGVVSAILSFCRYELNDTALADMLPYLKEKEVGVINASPVGMGLLTERGAPDWHPASDEIKEGCRKAVEYCMERGESIAKLAVQFACAHPDIPTTLVGSANPENMRNNIAWVDEPINEELLAGVMEVLKPIHNNYFTRGRPEHCE
ncbi:aldo/keto reductase [Rubellicoccus peritrichatus]|uniref:Aldo/keto reductase n=1 Tax=Rubellicoccus peritrichatus TaxID=3080537 RepID=A0AAQ3L691_9BACT|nr:aldo/keto reductase [Puniceicoccus sp. CR14]WOO40259.1 aldo/keto reductase [Puniceicoccus sp. CR14]